MAALEPALAETGLDDSDDDFQYEEVQVLRCASRSLRGPRGRASAINSTRCSPRTSSGAGKQDLARSKSSERTPSGASAFSQRASLP